MHYRFARIAKIGIVGLVLTVVLAGCSATPPKTGPLFSGAAEIPVDKTALYLYRPEREFNWAGWPIVTVNNDQSVALVNNGYFVFTVEPGSVLIKAEGGWDEGWWPGPTTRTINVEAGKRYYVRLVPHLPPGVRAGPHLFWSDMAKTHIAVMPEQEALREISSTRLIEK